MEPEPRSASLPSQDFTSSLYALWLEGALADCELVASDGAVLPAHRVVLAASSRFFKALFTGTWHDQQQQQQQHGYQQQLAPASSSSSGISCGSTFTSSGSSSANRSGLQQWKLSGVDSPSLQLLLHAIYSKRLPLTAEAAAEEVALLLSASNYLEVLPVKHACCQYLRSHLSLQTVAETLALAAAHDCHELLADAARFFEGHFVQLLKSEEAASLAVLPQDLLHQLLSSDGLNISSELDVAKAALLWAAADPEQRGSLLAELLPAARMPPGQLQEEAARCSLVQQVSTMCCAAMGEQQESAELYSHHQQQSFQQPPTQAEGGCDQLGHTFLHACNQLQLQLQHNVAAAGLESADCGSGLPAFRPRLSCATGLMMAGGLDDGWRCLRTVELYDPQKDCWTAGPLMPAPCSFAAAAMLGGHTYVVEGAAHAPSVLAFDRQQRSWTHCHALATPRVNMAVCALEEHLYVLGGRAGIGKGAAVLQEVEIFDPATNTWRTAPPMASPRTSLAGAALGGRLYAVGGQDNRSTHATFECFEPGAGRWVQLGCSMQHPRKYLGVASAGGRLIAVGGMTGTRMRLPTAEAFDPREGRWQALPPMSVARSSAGVAALHECVYVVGGNIGTEINDNYAGVEAWVPSAGRWRRCAPISHGRSGLSVAPL